MENVTYFQGLALTIGRLGEMDFATEKQFRLLVAIFRDVKVGHDMPAAKLLQLSWRNDGFKAGGEAS